MLKNEKIMEKILKNSNKKSRKTPHPLQKSDTIQMIGVGFSRLQIDSTDINNHRHKKIPQKIKFLLRDFPTERVPIIIV